MHDLRAGRGAHCAFVFVRRPSQHNNFSVSPRTRWRTAPLRLCFFCPRCSSLYPPHVSHGHPLGQAAGAQHALRQRLLRPRVRLGPASAHHAARPRAAAAEPPPERAVLVDRRVGGLVGGGVRYRRVDHHLRRLLHGVVAQQRLVPRLCCRRRVHCRRNLHTRVPAAPARPREGVAAHLPRRADEPDRPRRHPPLLPRALPLLTRRRERRRRRPASHASRAADAAASPLDRAAALRQGDLEERRGAQDARRPRLGRRAHLFGAALVRRARRLGERGVRPLRRLRVALPLHPLHLLVGRRDDDHRRVRRYLPGGGGGQGCGHRCNVRRCPDACDANHHHRYQLFRGVRRVQAQAGGQEGGQRRDAAAQHVWRRRDAARARRAVRGGGGGGESALRTRTRHARRQRLGGRRRGARAARVVPGDGAARHDWPLQADDEQHLFARRERRVTMARAVARVAPAAWRRCHPHKDSRHWRDKIITAGASSQARDTAWRGGRKIVIVYRESADGISSIVALRT